MLQSYQSSARTVGRNAIAIIRQALSHRARQESSVSALSLGFFVGRGFKSNLTVVVGIATVRVELNIVHQACDCIATRQVAANPLSLASPRRERRPEARRP